MLADRVLVLSSNPGRIRAELTVDLPRPRDRHGPVRGPRRHHLRHPHRPRTGRRRRARGRGRRAGRARTGGPALPPPSTHRCPTSAPGGLAGLLEILAARGGRDGLAETRRRPQLRDRRPAAADRRRRPAQARPHRRLGHRASPPTARSSPPPTSSPASSCSREYAAKHAPLVRTIIQALAATADHTLRDRVLHRHPPSRLLARARRAASSTRPSTGAGTPSSTTTTAMTTSSPSNPAPRNTSDPRDACSARQPSRCGPGVRGSKARSAWLFLSVDTLVPRTSADVTDGPNVSLTFMPSGASAH